MFAVYADEPNAKDPLAALQLQSGDFSGKIVWRR
jgi:hypothetical protein